MPVSAKSEVPRPCLLFQDYPACVSECRSALRLDPHSIKAYWRAAKASLAMDLFKQAVEFCEQAEQVPDVAPDMCTALTDLRQVKATASEQLARQLRVREEDSREYTREDAAEIEVGYM